MKFVKIITAAFLAANTFVAAYEVPNDNLIAELADEYDAKFVDYEDEVGSFESTKEFSAYGLRGSSSNEEFESADFVDWEQVACDSKKRMAELKVQIAESSGTAKETAKRHYQQAKEASLRAAAHIEPGARAAWEKTKETTSNAVDNARSWMKRHGFGFGEAYEHDDEEDEFDIQC
eukprot:scaffold40866_cov572-Skeletonema_dohrnii-CCMP3373.AAC.1